MSHHHTYYVTSSELRSSHPLFYSASAPSLALALSYLRSLSISPFRCLPPSLPQPHAHTGPNTGMATLRTQRMFVKGLFVFLSPQPSMWEPSRISPGKNSQKSALSSKVCNFSQKSQILRSVNLQFIHTRDTDLREFSTVASSVLAGSRGWVTAHALNKE